MQIALIGAAPIMRRRRALRESINSGVRIDLMDDERSLPRALLLRRTSARARGGRPQHTPAAFNSRRSAQRWRGLELLSGGCASLWVAVQLRRQVRSQVQLGNEENDPSLALNCAPKRVAQASCLWVGQASR